ncbi:hypothetical protein AVEN_147906-1, partial [Araneus ventricosus]
VLITYLEPCAPETTNTMHVKSSPKNVVNTPM